MKQRCFSHSEGVEESSIWRFLLRVFGNTEQALENRYNVAALELEEIETTFDMNESQITTLLQYIKLVDDGWIQDFGSM